MLRDDRVIIDDLGHDFQVGQQLVFDDIMMIGTADYTSIGRPSVESAKVFATLEEKGYSDKVIVFKKKRRQGYQKSRGHKQMLNVIKIDKIEHLIEENSL